MARIVTAIDIRAPIERVVDYAATPGNWPSWHPPSGSVGGAGRARITETIRTGGETGVPSGR